MRPVCASPDPARRRSGSLRIAALLAIAVVPAIHASAGRAWAVHPTRQEMADSYRWIAVTLEGTLPFSFVYDGRPSAQLLPDWPVYYHARRLGHGRTRHTLRWRDPATALVVEWVALEYRDSPTVEWTVFVRNRGTADSAIFDTVEALDATVERNPAGEFVLHHNVGSPADGSDYRPLETPLGPGATERITAAGGRPTNSDLSYFNLSWGMEGLIVVIGWPGQWAAEFRRDDGHGLRIRAGQELTRFRLRPGEEVRTPLIVLQPWTGDWVRGQNLWRRWMRAHVVPRPGGKLPRPMMLATSSRMYIEMERATEANQILFLDRYHAEGLKIDGWWMDAGWYVQRNGWFQTGTWEVDRVRFPRGLAPISDHAHALGEKTVLWFEPERVTDGTWLALNHPEWLLRAPSSSPSALLDLGNPSAWQWVVDHIDGLLQANRIDIYRQDLNIDPLQFWRANDAPDRQGITEIRYVSGYLAFWDALRQRNPDVLIDSCASGGRRSDLETMRRAVPLFRSDNRYAPLAQQGITYGISMWLPYNGTGTVAASDAPIYGEGWTPVEPYAFWSDAAPSMLATFDVRVPDLDYAALRTLFAQWRRVSRYYAGDYYPLTPYSRAQDEWIAWQFHRPEHDDGMVQAFRRASCADDAVRVNLRGLDARASYVVRQLGHTGARRVRGRRLMRRGLAVTVPERPGVAVLVYRAERR